MNVVLKRNGVVVLSVMRAIQKGDCPLPRGLEDWLADFGRAIELGEVLTPELLPLLRIVTEPLSQFGAWREVLEPAVKVQVGFLNPPRPKPLDQVAHAVRGAPLVVDSFQLDHIGTLSPAITLPWRDCPLADGNR